jgi:DNA invertase Pin-like site-specific DNA recombinase
LERQCDGIAKAKREGRYKGRVPTVRRQAAEIIRLKAEGVRTAGIARKLGDWSGEHLSVLARTAGSRSRRLTVIA